MPQAVSRSPWPAASTSTLTSSLPAHLTSAGGALSFPAMAAESPPILDGSKIAYLSPELPKED